MLRILARITILLTIVPIVGMIIALTSGAWFGLLTMLVATSGMRCHNRRRPQDQAGLQHRTFPGSPNIPTVHDPVPNTGRTYAHSHIRPAPPGLPGPFHPHKVPHHQTGDPTTPPTPNDTTAGAPNPPTPPPHGPRRKRASQLKDIIIESDCEPTPGPRTKERRT